MALKTGEKEINGVTFVVSQLGALEGSKTLLKLTKAVGPAIGTVARAVMAGAQGTEVLNAVLSSLQSLPENEFEALVKTFAASTKVKRPFTAGGKTIDQKLVDCIDDVLGGDYESLIAWLIFAVSVNYADFFAVAIRTMGKGEPPAEKAE